MNEKITLFIFGIEGSIKILNTSKLVNLLRIKVPGIAYVKNTVPVAGNSRQNFPFVPCAKNFRNLAFVFANCKKYFARPALNV